MRYTKTKVGIIVLCVAAAVGIGVGLTLRRLDSDKRFLRREIGVPSDLAATVLDSWRSTALTNSDRAVRFRVDR
jgi:hypothetical protein